MPGQGQDLTRLLPGQQARDTVPDDSVQLAPAPLPFDAIPLAAEQAEAELRDMAAALEPANRVARIEDDLIDEIAELNRRREELSALDLSGLSIRRMEDFRFGWVRSRARLEDWKRALAARWADLQDINDRLIILRPIWELTEREAVRDQYAENVRQRVRFVIGEIEEVDAALRDRFSAVLGIQNQIAEEERQVAIALSSFDQFGASAGTRAFVRDSPPIWQIAELGDAPWGVTGSAIDSAKERLAAFDEFVRVSRGDLWLVAGLFLVLLLGMVALRSRVEEWQGTDEDSVEAYRHVLLRPISSAFLLSLFFAGFFVSGPFIWGDLLTILAAIPVLRLIPGLVPAPLRAPLYGLVGLFVLDRVGDLTVEGSGVHRVSLLIVGALGILLFLWFLRRRDFMDWLRDRPIGRLAIASARIAVVLLGGAVVANTFGWVQLAELMSDGVFASVMIAVATAAAAIILFGLVNLFPHTRIGRSLRGVRRHGDLITARLTRFIRWFAVFIWAWSTLSAFLLWGPLVDWVVRILNRSFSIGFLSVSAANVISFFVILWGATLISRFLRFVLAEDVLPRLDLRRGVATTVSTLLHWTILAIGLLAAVSAAGLGSAQLTVMAGALGVGIGFGLQGIVNNFVSGLVLIFEQPIKVADTVEVGTLIGEVRRIGIRASVIRTFDGAEVIVPNANLVAGEVINWTLSDQKRRIEVKVGVKYGTDPEQVIDVLLGVAREHDEVIPYPAPQALFLGFGDSSLDFVMRAWSANFEDHFRIRSELNVRVNGALEEAGIEIPFPQRDLHLRSSSLTLEGSVQPQPTAPDPVAAEPEAPRDDA